MDDFAPKGFFAYPSNPAGLAETIRTAAGEVNRMGVVSLKTWEQCKVGGKVVIQELCGEIDQAQLFCADLTGTNANVMFELGYAIARDKRIWLVLDTTLSASLTQFEQLRILTTIGYAKYCNSGDIVRAFHTDQPYRDLGRTIFRQAIEPSLSPTSQETILYLKSRHETEASIRISKRIQELTKLRIPLIVDDPRESAIQTLTWYGTQVYSAEAIVCHLTNPEREGARIHNARYALVAGFAFGMDKKLLMLAEGDFLAPVDYRDLLRNYRTASEAVKYLAEWLAPFEESLYQKQASRRSYASAVRIATELKGLHLGEFVAENEADRLVKEYFVETASYREAVEGRQTIFVGRKGCGKTANLFKLAEELGKDRRNLVCVIKPVAYQLQGVIELLRKYKERDTKGYAIESLWKFLLYSEIALAAVRDIKHRPSGVVEEHEGSLVDLLEQQAGILKDDFSVRLERCVEALIAVRMEDATVESSRLAISEALHQGVLRELRALLGKVLRGKQIVSILVDNLDKAWDKQTDLPSLAEFLLGLLATATRLPIEFKHEDRWREPVNLGLAIFLRSDIFYKLLEVAREPDKIMYSKVAWNDPELLRRVIEERFVASHAGSVEPAELWTRYFCSTVKGVPVKEYLTHQILPRPRDLIFLVKAAVAMAVNRTHPVVTESDVLEAEKQYSQYALESIVVENGLTIENLEAILYEFVGSRAHLTREQVETCLAKASVPKEQYGRVIDHLSGLTFLGVEVSENKFRFAEDPQEYRKTLVLARKLAEQRGGGLRYTINPAFWAFLEIWPD